LTCCFVFQKQLEAEAKAVAVWREEAESLSALFLTIGNGNEAPKID